MRRKLVAGNWKMHGSRQFVADMLGELLEGTREMVGVDMVVCPSLVHLALAQELLRGSQIWLGAQNAYLQEEGAFTGEVAVAMLAEFSVRYVIVGHSERRQLFGEDDALVAGKFATVQEQGLCPILCLGETLEQRQRGDTERVVLSQLDAVLEMVGSGAFAGPEERAVIAYEPVWAIGSGHTASPEQAQQVHGAIRRHLARVVGIGAEHCRILYGGSVTSANAGKLFTQPDIDGGLVGGASLKASEFVAICKAGIIE